MPELHISVGADTDDKIQAGKVLGFNRQCSIGYHQECSDPYGEDCQCPCHQSVAIDLSPTLIEVSEGIWVNPDNVLAVRDRGNGEKQRMGPTCEVIGGQTGFVIFTSAETVVERINSR